METTVPENTRVYLTQPDFGVPVPPPEQPGRRPTRAKVLNETETRV
jgi:hypothetical protein